MDKQETTMILRRDELMKFLHERQDRLLDKMTDAFNRFRSSDNETFYEGYQECLKDIHDFFENRKGDLKMNEQQIVEYLKENFQRGVAFRFMPNEVQRWCMKHCEEDIFFKFTEEYGWGSKQFKICCLNSSVYALDYDYELKSKVKSEVKSEVKPDWVAFDIDDNGYFEFEGKKYYYREDARFETENRDRFKGFGGWLCADGKWRTYPPLHWNIGDVECYNGTCGDNCEPATPTKIRFWRRK